MGNILALDVSLANTGWAVLRVDGSTPEPLLDFGCIRTAPIKRPGAASMGKLDRGRAYTRELLHVIRAYKPASAVLELPTGSAKHQQQGPTMEANGLVIGVFAVLAEWLGLPLHGVTPQAVKKAAAGKNNAAKEAVQAVVLEVWPQVLGATGAEHVCDALGAVLAFRGEHLYNMARQVRN